MKCPNRRCRRTCNRVLITADDKGKLRRGCRVCFRRDTHVRTNRKIWHAYEVYGVEKTIQKNHDWIDNMAAKAAHNRRTAYCPKSMR